jgi:hypothetical protein
LEVLDASIVTLLEESEPLTQISGALFETGELAALMRKPLSYNQGLALDPTGRAAVYHQFESMCSQML